MRSIAEKVVQGQEELEKLESKDVEQYLERIDLEKFSRRGRENDQRGYPDYPGEDHYL